MPIDLLLVAECRATAAEDDASDWIERLSRTRPSDARFSRAAWNAARGDWPATAAALVAGFQGLEEDPWVYPATLRRALTRSLAVAREDPASGRLLWDVLQEPLPLYLEEELRKRTLFDLAGVLDFPGLCEAALRPFEPWLPWEEDLLAARVECYRRNRSPLLARALSDLGRFHASTPPELERGVPIG